MNISTLLRSLPAEVVSLIIPYTYQPQSRILLEDIRDFHETRQIAHDIYSHYWTVYAGEYISQDKRWLYNDLIFQANRCYPIMHGYTDDFYKIWFRNPQFQYDKQKVDRFVVHMEHDDNLDQAINLYFGILTPLERAQLVTRPITP